MYDRKEIKQKAKLAFKANYWKSVVICLILGLINGALYSSSGSSVVGKTAQATSTGSLKETFESITSADPALLMTIIAAIAAVFLLALLIGSAIRVFLINPFLVGGSGFFVKNSAEPAGIGEICGGFRSPSYMRNVGGMFLRDLFIILGHMVFIIPGIIVNYGFRLVPYILSEYPDIKPMDALKLSFEKMKGYKWKAFVLDLSFIGWDLLNICTCGILDIFYVRPYKEQARAEFYLAVKDLTR